MTNRKNIITERRVSLGSYIVRVDRIRRGRVQRKKLASKRKGYRVVGKRAKRMSTREIRKRKISSRRAAIKRRAKLSVTLKKRRISVAKGKRLGLYK